MIEVSSANVAVFVCCESGTYLKGMNPGFKIDYTEENVVTCEEDRDASLY